MSETGSSFKPFASWKNARDAPIDLLARVLQAVGPKSFAGDEHDEHVRNKVPVEVVVMTWKLTGEETRTADAPRL